MKIVDVAYWNGQYITVYDNGKQKTTDKISETLYKKYFGGSFGNYGVLPPKRKK